MALREVLARFGIRIDGADKLNKTDKRVRGLAQSLQGLGVAFGAGILIRGAARFTKQIIDQGDNLGKTAKQLGLSSDALQRWQFAAGQAGVDGGKMAQSMRLLQKNAVEADRTGTGPMAETFDKLGVSVKDANDQFKTGDALLTDLGEALSKIKNPTERVHAAQTLMGRSGAALLPLFEGGAEGIKKLREEVDALGGGFSELAVKQAEEAKDALGRFDFALTSVKSRIATAILPALTGTVNAIAKFVGGLAKAVEGTNLIKSALTSATLVGVFGLMKAFGRFLIPLGIAIAKFAILTLIIDDFLTLVTGGDSVLGRFLDRLLGKGFSENFAKEMGTIGAALVSFTDSSIDAEDSFTRVASAIASATDQLAKDFGEAFDFMIADLKSIDQAIHEWRDEIVKQFVDLAEDIATGFVDAMSAVATRIVDAIKQPFTDGTTEVKKALKSNSPSRTFAELARTIPQGVAMGVNQEAKVSDAAISGMVQRSIQIAGTRIQQTNHNNITVPGSGNPSGVARRVGNNVGQRSRRGLDQALDALVATV